MTQKMNIKLFADGANLAEMVSMAKQEYISGLTTNPTLMRKAGISDYKKFAHEVLAEIPDKPISFEVFSDDFDGMIRQAKQISTWGPNVYVKIPITNTAGIMTKKVISELSNEGIKLNITAMMTTKQIDEVLEVLDQSNPSYLSIFAGRIADTGVDPIPTIKHSLNLLNEQSKVQVIWASPRELLNVIQANDCGCHIITATSDILKKLSLIGKDLNTYSVETVQMFFNDASEAAYEI